MINKKVSKLANQQMENTRSANSSSLQKRQQECQQHARIPNLKEIQTIENNVEVNVNYGYWLLMNMIQHIKRNGPIK